MFNASEAGRLKRADWLTKRAFPIHCTFCVLKHLAGKRNASVSLKVVSCFLLFDYTLALCGDVSVIL
jgi:hypothetical protein